MNKILENGLSIFYPNLLLCIFPYALWCFQEILYDLLAIKARVPRVEGYTPLRCYSVVVHKKGDRFLSC
ncbi:hypothetical protein MetMK1DRAFT_00026220 [Metallosphaera yellowstonensis MK1]|jgi:hypothetical protein|uniref:Uncharacterized protein n=1 Tax=Metallosphaera yellowstonensis MK1 TaxID=671065 RepID=H2C7S3_9CREN|nr:hypothetical protein MetMK1DRAFT_00026220 [Metallosphaera yellowstonensis MK1]